MCMEMVLISLRGKARVYLYIVLLNNTGEDDFKLVEAGANNPCGSSTQGYEDFHRKD